MSSQPEISEAGQGEVVISVDAMGGDRGPSAVIAGIAKSARKNPDIRFILHGDAAELRRLAAKRLYARYLDGRCEFRNAPGVVTMDDKPSQVMRRGQDTSMWSALESVRNRERVKPLIQLSE